MLLAAMTAAPLPAAPKKILVVTTTMGFRHTSIPTGEKIIAQLAKESGAFTLDFVQQPEGKPAAPKKPEALKAGATEAQTAAYQAAVGKFNAAQAAYESAEARWEGKLKLALAKLSPDSLKNYAAVAFVSTTGELPIPDREGFLAWIRSGGAFIGIHAASDTFHQWPEFLDMIGGEFLVHPPGTYDVEVINQDKECPACRHLGNTWKVNDEIYLFKNFDRAQVHGLLTLDKHPKDKTPGDYPVAWTKSYGNGKVFYTSLGHREDLWDADPGIKDRKNPAEVSKAYQAHILGGIQWALGLEAGPEATRKD